MYPQNPEIPNLSPPDHAAADNPPPAYTGQRRHNDTHQWMSVPVVVVVGILTVAAFTIVGVMNLTGNGKSLADVANQCATTDHLYATVDGDGLIVDRVAAEEPPDGATYDELLCVLDALETPDTVTARMGTTRALDGTQAAEWDGLEATWTYHPNSGLTLIVSEVR